MTQRILDTISRTSAAESPSPAAPPIVILTKWPSRTGWRWVSIVMLLLAVVLALTAAIAFTDWNVLQSGAPYFVLPLTVAVLAVGGLYAQPQAASFKAAAVRAVGLLSFAGIAAAAILYALAYSANTITAAVLTAALAVLLVPAGRAIAAPLLMVLGSAGVGKRPLVVAGTREEAAAAASVLEALGGRYKVSAVIGLPNGGRTAHPLPDEGVQVALADALKELSPNCEFVIAAPAAQLQWVESAVRPYLPEHAPVYVDVAALLGGPATGTISAVDCGLPAVRLRARHESWRYSLVKRGMDIAIALAALVAAAPLMLLIALAIKVESRGSVLFRQTRVGRQGQTFSMRKFRSMRAGAEAVQAALMETNEAQGPMFKIRNDPRMTRVGKIIRRLSLDELPQLLNVLEGTMSIVGPRPPLPQEVMQYQEWQLRRLELTPGITGLWQVSRNDMSSFEEMVQMDLTYTDCWSLGLDAKVLLKTLPAMILARGAY